MADVTVYGVRAASGRTIAFYALDQQDAALRAASLGVYDAFMRDYVRGSVALYEEVGPGHYRPVEDATHGKT